MASEFDRARGGVPRALALLLVAAVVGIALAGSSLKATHAAVGTCNLSSTNYTVLEGNTLNIPVLRTGTNLTDAVVTYQFTEDTAQFAVDYLDFAGTLNFVGTQSSRVIELHTVDRANVQPPRNLMVSIDDNQDPACALGPTTTATITIEDGDGPQPAVITAISPHSGSTAGGTVVTLTGSNFTGVTCPAGVTFGGTAATACNVISDSQMTATAPPKAASTYHIRVDNGEGEGLSAETPADLFQYFAGPVVQDVNPSSAPAGQNTPGIIITGQGFSGTDCDPSGGLGVEFGLEDAVSCSVNVDGTQITATAPSQPVSTVDVRVTNGTTSPNTPDDDFSYTGNAPVVTGLSPSSGPVGGGTSVTITGQYLSGATHVYFGGMSYEATDVHVSSSTMITAKSPQVPGPGKVDVTVTTPSGTSSPSGTGNDYTYTAPPTITDLNPDTGPTGGGNAVVITGTNLFGVTSVTFGGINATGFTVDGATQITATAPPHALGVVRVAVTNASGTSPDTSADNYEYLGGPNITSVTPTGGPTTGGTSVTIEGSGFTGVTAVDFGGTPATSFHFVDDTEVTAVSPAHAAGPVHIHVTAPGGTSPSVDADRFTYGVPVVTDVSPGSGPKTGGNFVTITGSNFTNATKVLFGPNESPIFAVSNDSSITAQAPAGTGIVHVRVVTAAGTSATSSADEYSYNALPTISSLSPNMGPAAGGTVVVITGTDFDGTTSVAFGSKAASGFTIDSNTRITAVAPPASPGEVTVRVTTPKGTSPNVPAATYTYKSAAALTTYTLSFRWNLVTWAGPTGMDIIAALQGLDSDASTNSIYNLVTAVYYWQNPGWLRFFPDGVNVPGVNTLNSLVFGQAYWIAVAQTVDWSVHTGP